MNNCDLALSLGGDNYSLNYNMPVKQLTEDLFFIKKKKPCLFWSGSLDKAVKLNKFSDLFFNFFKNFNLIYVRENLTYKILKKKKFKNLYFFPEIAHTLKPQKSQRLFRNNFSNLGINLFNEVGSYKIDKSQEKVILDFLKIILKKKINVTLVPHTNVTNRLKENEYDYLFRIYKILKIDFKNIKILPKNLTCEQTKYYISKLNFFFTLRYHAYIAAVSSNVPTAIFSYSFKSLGINKIIFNNNKLLINIKNISKKKILSSFKYMMLNHKEIKKSLINYNNKNNNDFVRLKKILNIYL